jgi:hypothetical protein
MDESTLQGVDETKRATLRRLMGGAFVTPVVASFAMSGLSIDSALAQCPNSSFPGCSGIPSP